MDISKNDLIGALQSVVWYNGLECDLIKWLDIEPINGEILFDRIHAETSGDWEEIMVIWMICVVLFGEYGTSPRTGWIEKVDDFKEFIGILAEVENDNS